MPSKAEATELIRGDLWSTYNSSVQVAKYHACPAYPQLGLENAGKASKCR